MDRSGVCELDPVTVTLFNNDLNLSVPCESQGIFHFTRFSQALPILRVKQDF